MAKIIKDQEEIQKHCEAPNNGQKSKCIEAQTWSQEMLICCNQPLDLTSQRAKW